jgi:hypothetical protein
MTTFRFPRSEVTLLVIFIALTPLLLTPWIHGIDGVGYYSYLPSVVINHNLDLSYAYAHYSKTFPYLWHSKDPITHLTINSYLVGTAILWSPFFLAGHLFAILSDYPADGFSAPYVVATCLGSSIYAFLALILAYRFSKRFFPNQDCILATVGIWFASSLIYYMWLDPSMSHSVSAFLVALFLYATCVWHPKRADLKWPAAGFLVGLLAITRPADLGFVVIPILLLFPKYVPSQRKENSGPNYLTLSKNTLAFATCFGLCVLPQLLAWRILMGTFFPPWEMHIQGAYLTSLGGAWTPLTLLLLPRVFISPLHGLFYWTPITALGVIGAGLMLRDKNTRNLGCGIILAILIQAVLVNGWSAWWAPTSFGQRFFLNATSPLVLGLASFNQRTRDALKSSWPSFALVFILILWNLGLLIQFGTGILGSDEPESFITVATNDVFIVLPQLVSILLRFLTNRLGHSQLNSLILRNR